MAAGALPQTPLGELTALSRVQTPWLGLTGPTSKALLLRGGEGRKWKWRRRGAKMIYAPGRQKFSCRHCSLSACHCLFVTVCFNPGLSMGYPSRVRRHDRNVTGSTVTSWFSVARFSTCSNISFLPSWFTMERTGQTTDILERALVIFSYNSYSFRRNVTTVAKRRRFHDD